MLCVHANSVETLGTCGTFRFLGLTVTSKKCRQFLSLFIIFCATKELHLHEKCFVVRHAGELIALIQEVCPRQERRSIRLDDAAVAARVRRAEMLFRFSLRLEVCFPTHVRTRVFTVASSSPTDQGCGSSAFRCQVRCVLSVLFVWDL